MNVLSNPFQNEFVLHRIGMITITAPAFLVMKGVNCENGERLLDDHILNPHLPNSLRISYL